MVVLGKAYSKSLFILLSLLLALFSGCSNNLHFKYEPSEIEPPQAAQENIRKLKIAVMTFEDARETDHSGSTNYALIPLVPTWKETVSSNQGAKQSFTSADYYYPGLIAYAIARDLEANAMAGTVHLNPSVTEHYDLVIRGRLTRLEFSSRKLTYGLSAAGQLLQMVFLPTGFVSVDSEADIEVFSPVLNEVVYASSLSGDWGNAAYNSHEDSFLDEVATADKGRRKIHGVVDCFREISEALIEDITPEIEILAEEINDSARKEAFYSSLDPQLASLAARLKSPAVPANAKSGIARTIRTRVAALETYRQKEFQRLQQEDQLKRAILDKRHRAIEARRNQIAHYKYQQMQVEKQRGELAGKQFGSVARAVAQGMATRNQSGFYSRDENLQAALQDFATGAAQIEPVSIPAFPADELIAQLDQNLPGLPALGADPFAEYGKRTLPEIRQRFLQKYRSRF